MSDAIWALQRALYQALAAEPGIQTLLGNPVRIYDDPPAGAELPYLVIGPTQITDWAGVDRGLQHDLRLHAFSAYAGRREIKQIMGAVYDALHEANLTVDGHRLVNIRFVFADAVRRRDANAYQGVMRYRAVTQPL